MDEYGPSTCGRIADVYDTWYGARLDTADAVEFLAPLARDGRALELSIGTGRVARPLAERGVDVKGIDASSRMLEEPARSRGNGHPRHDRRLRRRGPRGAVRPRARRVHHVLGPHEPRGPAGEHGAQVVEGHHLYVTEQATTLDPVRIRDCWPPELYVMAHLSGLGPEERAAWHDRTPFHARATRHVSVYRRP